MNMIVTPVIIPMRTPPERKSITVGGIKYEELFQSEVLRRIKRDGVTYEEVVDGEPMPLFIKIILWLVGTPIAIAVLIFFGGAWLSLVTVPFEWLHICKNCAGWPMFTWDGTLFGMDSWM